MKKTKITSLALVLVFGCLWMAGAETEGTDDIVKKQEAAIAELESYIGGGAEKDFTESDKKKLTGIREKGKNAIDKAKDSEAIQKALSNAENEIDAIYGTILDVRKKEAQDTLHDYFGKQKAAKDFTGNQWKNLIAIKEEGREKIGAAKTVAEMSNALDAAMTAIDSALTDTEMAEAASSALAAAKKQLNGVEGKIQKKYKELYKIGTESYIAASNAQTNKDWTAVTANVEKINTVVADIRKVADTEKRFLALLIMLIAVGSIASASLVIAILSLIKSTADNKRLQAAQEALEGIASKMDTLLIMYKDQGKTLTYIETAPNQIRKLEEKLEERFDGVERSVWDIDTCIRDINVDLKNNKRQPESFSPLTEKTPGFTSDPVSAFNIWASNPISRLPDNFYYLEHDMRVRREQSLTPSATETRWISNKDASKTGKKYLFPNPNFFDQMTDISELYIMDLTKLRPRGQNRITITKPCEMSGSGYINYHGELTLL
ncbi:MAG: hypothetical protein LBP19_08160 [Treponema sp.]|jgi:type II secretory pathway pseudopilin PulG|nr:hypothetical protein [Treponema sp.]